MRPGDGEVVEGLGDLLRGICDRPCQGRQPVSQQLPATLQRRQVCPLSPVVTGASGRAVPDARRRLTRLTHVQTHSATGIQPGEPDPAQWMGAGSVRLTLTDATRQEYLDDMTGSRNSAAGATRLGTLCCSFCSKEEEAVAKLVAGPGVYICNECVELCNHILAEQSVSKVAGWGERTDDELLASLARVQALVSQVDAAVHDHVDILRARGISWTRIGEALGVSKQAAWERFSGED